MYYLIYVCLIESCYVQLYMVHVSQNIQGIRKIFVLTKIMSLTNNLGLSNNILRWLYWAVTEGDNFIASIRKTDISR